MRIDPRRATTAQLIELVGVARSSLSADLLAKAEAELARRTESTEEAYKRRVRTTGTVCAAIGIFMLIWGLAMSAFGYAFFSGQAPPPTGRSFIPRHFSTVYIGVALVEAASGGLLLVGGLGVRRFRRYGPRLVLAVLSLGFVFVVLFTVEWVGSLLLASGGVFSVLMAGAGALNAAFWSALLYLPFRYFSSSRLRAVCRQHS